MTQKPNQTKYSTKEVLTISFGSLFKKSNILSTAVSQFVCVSIFIYFCRFFYSLHQNITLNVYKSKLHMFLKPKMVKSDIRQFPPLFRIWCIYNVLNYIYGELCDTGYIANRESEWVSSLNKMSQKLSITIKCHDRHEKRYNSVILSDDVEGSLLALCKHLFTKATKADILYIDFTVWINDLISLNRTWEI